MMKSKKIDKLWELIIFLLLALTVIVARPVKAAGSTRVDLRTGHTYRYYDVTGNGKNDKFAVKAATTSAYTGNGYYDTVNIYVNGKKQSISYKKAPFYRLNATLYIFDNDKPLLYLGAKSDNDHKYINGILKYENGKWKYLLDMTKVFGNYKQYARGEVISNSGKDLKVRYEIMCWTLGFCRVDYTYTYEKGGLKRKSSYGKIVNYFALDSGKGKLTANKTIRAYKECGDGEIAFVLRKGKKVTVQKWRYTGGKLYIQLKYGTKTGWINGQKQKRFVTSEQRLFSNLPYV